jgi:hypothetical protein
MAYLDGQRLDDLNKILAAVIAMNANTAASLAELQLLRLGMSFAIEEDLNDLAQEAEPDAVPL